MERGLKLTLLHVIRHLIYITLIFTACKVSERSNVVGHSSPRDISIRVTMVTLDPLQNLLVLDQNNRVHRFTQGGQQYVYADNTLGRITHISAGDPLKIVLYKNEFGAVIILDNTMSDIHHLDLSRLGYDQVPAVAGSSEGNLWIYDGSDYRLKKISRDGRPILESTSMLDLGQQDIHPSFIQERNGKVVMQDHQKGVFLFDNLGQFIQHFPFAVQNNIQWDGTSICFFEEDTYTCYDTRFYRENTFLVPQEKKTGIQDMKAGRDNFYLIYADGIDIIPKQS